MPQVADRITDHALLLSTLTAGGREALAALERASRHPEALRAEVCLILAGERPNIPRDPQAVSLALGDMSTNGVGQSGRALRAYVQDAARQLLSAAATAPGAGNEFDRAARQARAEGGR